LITNYSMLSVALSRSDEQPIIQATRSWLEASQQHVFTLVIDELHMYRGTAGTVVAYLLRRLLMALGLNHRPQQLRVIGTSASLGDDSEGRKFLAQLFGRRSEGFTFVRGDLDQPEGADHLDGLAHALLEPDAEQTLLPSDGTLQRSLTRA